MDTFLVRTPNSILVILLNDFIKQYKKSGLSPGVAEIFYQFIIYSYKMSREERYSISALAYIFNKANMKTSLFLNIYTHSLYCLALWNKQKIYEDFIP
jgi:hypothetical protein